MANPICKGFWADRYFKLYTLQLHIKNKDLLIRKNMSRDRY